MKRKLKKLMLLLTIFINTSIVAQTCCEVELFNQESLDQISKKYQGLRKLRNEECCTYYGSGLMKIMMQLSDSLNIGISENRIIEIMGEPDLIATQKEPLDHHFTQLNENQKVLIYKWRGLHDFLYFELNENKLFYKNWYYALE
jgi:hypothetical protein